MVTYAKLTADLIGQLTKCKAIGRFGLGVDNIDLPACKEKGIAVNYVPDYCIHEVSDHTMAMLLSLIRKIPFSDKLVQAGRWEMPAVVPITPHPGHRARPHRLRQYPAAGGAEGEGVRAEGDRL